MTKFHKINLYPTKLKIITDEIFSLSSVLYEFCKHNSEDEKINIITPLVEILTGKIDNLNAYFSNK